MQGSPVEIQIAAHSNLIGRIMTAPMAVIAQQYSSATFVSLRLYSRKENFDTLFEKLWFQFLFRFLHRVRLKQHNINLHNSGSVSTYTAAGFLEDSLLPMSEVLAVILLSWNRHNVVDSATGWGWEVRCSRTCKVKKFTSCKTFGPALGPHSTPCLMGTGVVYQP